VAVVTPDRITRYIGQRQAQTTHLIAERRADGIIIRRLTSNRTVNLELGLLQADAPPRKITGHKTESVYRRYAIVSDADLREATEKLDHGHISGPIQVGVVDSASISRQNS
jgi:hypothetical protein